jgi:lipid-A-disaccharide synthase-like uncharacterized protein
MLTILAVYALYFAVGATEWVLACWRCLALLRKKKALLLSLVFVEQILGLLVLSQFVRQNDWVIAIVYAVGASFGSLIPLYIEGRKEKKDAKV